MRLASSPILNMSVNCASTIYGVVSKVLNNKIDQSDESRNNWPCLWAKLVAQTSLLSLKSEHQFSVNGYWPCILVNRCAMWLLLPIYTVWTTLLPKMLICA